MPGPWKLSTGYGPAETTFLKKFICNHSSRRVVEDLYINRSDEELLKAVDSMTFDHGETEILVSTRRKEFSQKR
jgi:hypothetical protein